MFTKSMIFLIGSGLVTLQADGQTLEERFAALGVGSGVQECLLEPSMITDVGSPVRGVISEVLVGRGDVVQKGQVIARIDARAERAAVELAKARVEFTRRRIERNQELVEQDLVSGQELDEMSTEFELAELELRERRVLLEMRTIRSPVNGVVVDRVGAPGEYIENTEIVKLAQIHPLYVEVVLPKAYFGRATTDLEAEVILEAPSAGVYHAKIEVVDKVIDAASNTFRVRLEIPNADLSIPSGLRCTVSFSFD